MKEKPCQKQGEKCNSLYLQKIKINMSEISLKVINDKMLTDFIQFPMTLYKNNPNYVPALINDEKQIWDPKKTRHSRTAKPSYILLIKTIRLLAE